MRLQRRRPRLQRRGFRGVKPLSPQIAERFFVLRTHAGGDAGVPVRPTTDNNLPVFP